MNTKYHYVDVNVVKGTDPITHGYIPTHTTKHDSQILNIVSIRNI